MFELDEFFMVFSLNMGNKLPEHKMLPSIIQYTTMKLLELQMSNLDTKLTSFQINELEIDVTPNFHFAIISPAHRYYKKDLIPVPMKLKCRLAGKKKIWTCIQ